MFCRKEFIPGTKKKLACAEFYDQTRGLVCHCSITDFSTYSHDFVVIMQKRKLYRVESVVYLECNGTLLYKQSLLYSDKCTVKINNIAGK